MYQWVAVELRTGKILADLPLLDVDTVKLSLGRYETAQATLPISLEVAPAEWLRATLPGGANLILLADNPNDAAHGIPVAGFAITRRRRTESDEITLSLITLEGYFDRRYVGGQTFTATGQNTIMQTLTTSYIAAGNNGGIPLRVAVTGGAGTARDRVFTDQDDKTIYSIFQDLNGISGGAEWTVGWEWQTAPERLTPVLYISSRIGSPVSAGLTANAVFDMPGCVKSFELLEDYGVGKGANDVMAYSSGSGTVRPQSTRQVYADPQRPTFEYRWTPSTSVIDTTTLNAHAVTALPAMQFGSTALGLTAQVDAAPKLGIDWFLGDDIGYAIGGLDQTGRDTVPSVPGGETGTARAIGVELKLANTAFITPILIGASGVLNG